MINLSDDEVALIKSLLIAIRTIKSRDIDKAIVMLSQGERRWRRHDEDSPQPPLS